MADPMDLMAGSGGQPIPKDFNAQDAQNMEDVRLRPCAPRFSH